MALYDQGRAKNVSGSAPKPAPKPDIIPLKEDYVPGVDDDPIVKEAYDLKQQFLKHQIDHVQTKGRQKGYTKLDCEDIVDS